VAGIERVNSLCAGCRRLVGWRCSCDSVLVGNLAGCRNIFTPRAALTQLALGWVITGQLLMLAERLLIPFDACHALLGRGPGGGLAVNRF